MSLEDIVSINVSATTVTPTRAGFGTPLLAVAKVPWTSGARVRSYATLAAVLTAGFLTTDPAYQMARTVFSQNPSPPRVKIAQRDNAPTQIVHLTPASPVSGSASETYTAKVDGLTTSFASDATPTVAEVCTGLAAAINALTGVDVDAIVTTGASTAGTQTLTGALLDGVIGNDVMAPTRRLQFTFSNHADWDATTITVTGTDGAGATQTETFTVPNGGNATVSGTKYFRSVVSVAIPAQSGTGGTFTMGVRASVTADGSSTTHVVCTAAVAGILHSYELVTGNLTISDETADPGLAADLGAILAFDSDWYGLAIDSNSEAEINAAATWTEANGKLFVAQSADSRCGDPSVTTDVMSDLKAAADARSTCWFYPAICTSTGWLAAGILGDRLPVDPGSDTWAFKTIAGVTALTVSTTAHDAILAKNGNTYETVAGVNVTFPGKTASGEWVDVTRGMDWFRARLRERLFALLVANEKVPFTDTGIDMVRGAVAAQIKEAVRVSLFAADPKPTITTPRAADVDAAQRAARNLPGVTFSAQLAGAIHTLAVTGIASA